mmetsp:Transcript_45812/g.109085  ORF Transcript_45812/g.109085 Transcript_45812/m.109085 type:complete len:264 (+) Transcript_45812:98-889(+)|eukprot:CAMPEP_0178440950 /NCGR_PEP_ID=MMETSP0689_2-20121128/37157_1 /TAXON_ID=160604 /ORGANISM="Amphidinium massartii, Strain CS-259" /LENGTH=263 /DNA_ID=CAMNT_0020063969 /DNA_START=32 /DNA_END=823 /DNA_ORIENTATION=-
MAALGLTNDFTWDQAIEAAVAGRKFELAHDVDSSTQHGSDCSGSELGDSEWDEQEGMSKTGSNFTDTLTIFDWDDTLLPTHWIEAQGLTVDDSCVLSEEQMEKLVKFERQAMRTLETATRYGEVIVITNAEAGWVEVSSEKFMPALNALLKGVRVVSARSTYEPQGVTSASEWKFRAFLDEIRRFFEAGVTGQCKANVISIGDSPHEREALIRATDCLPNSCIKALKFARHPGVDELLKQHQLVGGCFEEIAEAMQNLDINID